MRPLEFVKVQYPKCYPFVDRIHRVIDRFCLNRIDSLVAVSEDVKEAYIQRYPDLRNKDKIRVISGSGVDLDAFTIKDRESIRKVLEFNDKDFLVLFVGRLERIKNVEFLIRSFSLLKCKVNSAKLLIAGRGPEEPNLRELARDLGVEGDVLFLGEVNPLMMPGMYNCADVLAITSFSESGPTVARESLACGTPVVSTNVGNMAEIIRHEPLIGAVVNTFDEELFSSELCKIATNRGKHDAHHVKSLCRNTALNNFGAEKVTSDYIKIYSDLIS